MDEHMKDCSTIPSAAKEHILAFLESKERSPKVLTNVLKFKVRDLVSSYEQCYGQVPLGTWEYVLQQLGYYERQLVPAQADQMIADATYIADLDGLEGNGCDDFSLQAAAENGPSHRSNIIPPTVQSLSLGNSSPLGLGPVDKNERKIEGREENLAASSVQADHKQQSIGKTTTPSRPTTPEGPRSTHDPVVTGQRGSRQNNAMDKPYPPRNGEESQESSNLFKNATENDCYRGENDCIGNNNGPDAKLQKIIRQQDEHIARAKYQLVMLKKENKELFEELCTAIGKIQHVEKQRLENEQKLQEERGKFQSWKEKTTEEFKGFQESKRKQVKDIEGKLTKEKREMKRMKIQLARERNQRKRVEREMEKRNNKKVEDLKQNESFLVQKLSEKTAQLQNCQAQKICLQQELEEFRAELQSAQRRSQESTELVAESQELNRKATQHIRQLDQRYDNANHDMEDLRSECQQLSEELQLAFNQMRDLQERHHNLEREREQVRLQDEERMAEAAQAFNNAETDKVKRLKQKLAQEKRKRKALSEKNRQLEAFVKELRSKEEGHFPSGGSGEDNVHGEISDSSTTASSELEDDVQFGSSNHNQQLSDSDDSNEDHGHLDDASTDAIESKRQK